MTFEDIENLTFESGSTLLDRRAAMIIAAKHFAKSDDRTSYEMWITSNIINFDYNLSRIIWKTFSDPSETYQMLRGCLNHYIYCASEKSFYYNSGPKWTRDEFGRVNAFIEDCVSNVKLKEYHAARNQASNILKSSPVISVHSNDFDRDDHLLNVYHSDLINLKTGKFENRNGRFMRRICDVRISNPAAFETAVEAFAGNPLHHPKLRWISFISETFNHDIDAIGTVQTYLGTCLSGDVRHEKFAILYGLGGNGKSVLLQTLQSILNSYAATPADNVFMRGASSHSSRFAVLAGARAILISELASGSALNESVVKRWTSGDTFSAAHKNCDEINFQPKGKILAATNYRPTIPEGQSPAISRRTLLIGFNHTPISPDPQIFEKLDAEREMILAWLVAGALRYYQSGLSIAGSIATDTADYLTKIDLLKEFIDSKLDFTYIKRDTVLKITKAYNGFLKDAGMNTIGKNTLIERLAHYKIKDTEDTRGRRYLVRDDLYANIRSDTPQ